MRHMAGVAELLRSWALARGEPPREVARWSAVGFLHDALRDAPEEEARLWAGEEFSDAPPSVLHGPALAARLRVEGVRDEEVLLAVEYHTFGHPGMGVLGRALIAADALEPGRDHRPQWRAALARRMPGDLEAVVREVVRARMLRQLVAGRPLRPETAGFWNSLVEAQGE